MSELKSAYFQCTGGISGDMVLGAVVDAGVRVGELNRALASLGQKGLSLSTETAQRGGVRGTRVAVRSGRRGVPRLGVGDFIRITQESGLPPVVIERACTIFRRLGEAEASVHGTSADDVTLHELGTLDTLADVVGSVVGLEMLGVGRLYSSPVPSGSGVIEREHGMLPALSPVAAALLAMAKAPVVAPPGSGPDAGEMVTPTGAAIVTTLASFSQPTMNLEKVGYGLGERESRDYPNVLALWTGEELGSAYVSDLSLIETNVDDMSPELLSYVHERLFELGARDVWFTPIQMKKNRPATMLSALVESNVESRAVELVMRETSSLGVRVRPAARYEAERELVEVETSLGAVQVKIKRLGGVKVSVSPEYEACRLIAIDRGMPLQDVYRAIQAEAADKLLS